MIKKPFKDKILENLAVIGIFLIVVFTFFKTYPIYQVRYVNYEISSVPFLPNAYFSEKININTADVLQLQVLSGIGEKKAQDIILYRETHGAFKTVEEIQNVKGIGAKTFKEIKNKICIA
ncbi:MAG: ComEA family DNA-binding protein [Oscillospiraceae bacterium]|nr:ComEA family DNA-binding protein [Oscillospiraceae bacterium]